MNFKTRTLGVNYPGTLTRLKAGMYRLCLDYCHQPRGHLDPIKLREPAQYWAVVMKCDGSPGGAPGMWWTAAIFERIVTLDEVFVSDLISPIPIKQIYQEGLLSAGYACMAELYALEGVYTGEQDDD